MVIVLDLLSLQENVLPETIKIFLGVEKISSKTQTQSRDELDLAEQDLKLAVVLFGWCLGRVGATMELKVLDIGPKTHDTAWLD